MTFNLTAEQFAAKKIALANQGIDVPPGTAGTITSKGVSVSYLYVEPVLTITVKDYGGHMHFLVDDEIKDWFKS